MIHHFFVFKKNLATFLLRSCASFGAGASAATQRFSTAHVFPISEPPFPGSIYRAASKLCITIWRWTCMDRL